LELISIPFESKSFTISSFPLFAAKNNEFEPRYFFLVSAPLLIKSFAASVF